MVVRTMLSKSLIVKSIRFSLFLSVTFIKSVCTETRFTIKLMFFLYRESKNPVNRRILEGSFIGEFPIGLFSNFISFVKLGIDRKNRFKNPRQQPALFYLNFLKSKPWYHSHDSSDDVDAEVERIKEQLMRNLAIFKKSYAHVKSITSTDSRHGELEGDWTVFPLYSCTGKVGKNCKKCPEIVSIIDSLPRFSYGMAYFSIMHPDTYVPGHYGPTNTKLRYHLGLDVPDDVFFRVSNKLNSWIQDGCIVLDDSFYHEVYQQSSRKRVVFILDCWHPQLSLHERILITKLMKLAILYSHHPATATKVYK